MLSSVQEFQQLINTKPSKKTRIIFRYLMSPIKLIGDGGKINRVEFDKNDLKVNSK